MCTLSERAAEGAVPVLLAGVAGIRVGVEAARDLSFFMGLHTYTYTCTRRTIVSGRNLVRRCIVKLSNNRWPMSDTDRLMPQAAHRRKRGFTAHACACPCAPSSECLWLSYGEMGLDEAMLLLFTLRLVSPCCFPWGTAKAPPADLLVPACRGIRQLDETYFQGAK
jgi:hypothetical protein